MTQNKLVAQQIKPLSASMTGSVWDGDQVHFNMQIEVAEFTFRDSTHPGPVMLESIDFGVMDWKELANREFTFPRNPEDGYVDGGLALLWEWIPADLLKIVFGDAGTSSIPATLTIDFDFEWPLGDPNHKRDDHAVQWELLIEINTEELDDVSSEVGEFRSEAANYRPDIEHPVLGGLSWDKTTQNYWGQTKLNGQIVRFGLAAQECDDLDALVEAASELTLDLHEVATAAARFLHTHSPSAGQERTEESPTKLMSYVVYPGGPAVWMFMRGTSIEGVTMASDRSFELL